MGRNGGIKNTCLEVYPGNYKWILDDDSCLCNMMQPLRHFCEGSSLLAVFIRRDIMRSLEAFVYLCMLTTVTTQEYQAKCAEYSDIEP